MRVWVLENTPDYEQATRHGIFASPVLAWDALFDLVKKYVFDREIGFSLYVGGQRDGDPKDQTRPIMVEITYDGYDKITLNGELLRGGPQDGYPPSLTDWRDLQQVGGLIRAHAVQEAGYEVIGEVNGLATGRWTFRPTD